MKSVRGHRYLAKRGDVFYFRRAVPKGLAHVFGGRLQVWQSLETSELSVARSKLQPLVDDFEARVAKVRGEIAPSKIARSAHAPEKREIERVVRVAFAKRVDRTRQFDLRHPNERDAARTRLEELKAFINVTEGVRGICQDTAPQDVFWQAEAICEEQGWPVDDTMPHWPLLADLVARSQIEAATRELQQLEGKPEGVRDAVFAPQEFLRDERSSVASKYEPISLMTLFDEYVTETRPS